MASRREQILWPTLFELAKWLEDAYGLVAVCSAGIVALAEKSAKEREMLVRRTKQLTVENVEQLLAQVQADDIVSDAQADATKRRRKKSRQAPKSA